MLPISKLAGILSQSGTPSGPETTIASFVLSSPLSGILPFTINHIFRQGDVVAGKGVATANAIIQVKPKNFWPDGSLKIAVISGTYVSNGSSATIILMTGSYSSGANLTTGNLQAALSSPVSIGCGSIGTCTWSGADFDSPQAVWITGHMMSSWVYRKAVGSDPGLAAWIEVRLYITGDVEILPWLENGYCKVAGVTNHLETYTFSLSGSQRCSVSINMRHHQRAPIINGAEISYWSGTTYIVTPRHDTVYMQATEIVPTYRGSLADNNTLVTALPATFVPHQPLSNNYDGDFMDSPGFQYPIGLLPTHDVLYLTTAVTATNVYAAVLRNGFSAGRYPIHYRNESTMLPVGTGDFPNTGIDDNQGVRDNGSCPDYMTLCSGGYISSWGYAHHPSLGFMAYLLSGYMYFLEELLFVRGINNLNMSNYLRGGGGNAAQSWAYNSRPTYSPVSGLCVPVYGSVQTRSAAWSLRTLAQALCITPDGHPNQPNLIFQMEENCRFFSQIYIENQNNPYGYIGPGDGAYSPIHALATWQQDFFTAAWGYSLSMNLPISGTARIKMTNIFKWKARSAIMRLGKQGDFWYVNCNPYTANIVDAASGSYGAYSLGDFDVAGVGPWLPNDAAVYASTYASQSPWGSSVEGIIGLEFGEEGVTAQGYFGNLQPAIAYAVRHGVVGAKAGYDRMVSATNWGAISAFFSLSRPVWGIAPASIPSAATTISVSAPAGGASNIPSSNFVVSVNGPISENVTVTPSCVSGTFVPSTITLTAGPTPSATFTYTPTGSDGPRTIVIRNSGRLNNPNDISFNVNSTIPLPTWMNGKQVNEWFQIPGTSDSGGAVINAYCGMALNPAKSELYIAAAGGHLDSPDNRVVSLDLSLNAPSWVQRKGSTHNGTETNVLYYADGSPASRHTYNHIYYMASRNAVILTGCRYAYGTETPSGPGMDLFDLTINDWLPRYTIPDSIGGFGIAIDNDGNVWTQGGAKYTVSTNTWSVPGTGPTSRFMPTALDTSRNVIFNLQWADGQGFDPQFGVTAIRLDAATGNRVPITFNPSPALTEFVAAAPEYAGMDYDPVNDKFYFCHGRNEQGKIYVITPNAGTVWDMSVLATFGPPPTADGNGIHKKFLYVPALKGFVLNSRKSDNLFFIRTS